MLVNDNPRCAYAPMVRRDIAHAYEHAPMVRRDIAHAYEHAPMVRRDIAHAYEPSKRDVFTSTAG